jgi:hypothetical protein
MAMQEVDSTAYDRKWRYEVRRVPVRFSVLHPTRSVAHLALAPTRYPEVALDAPDGLSAVSTVGRSGEVFHLPYM